jgi:hypothetical protein
LNCFEKGQDIRRFSPTLSMDNVKTLTPLLAAALLISSAIVFMSHIPQVEAADNWVVFNVKTADTNTPIRNAKIIINNTIAVYTNAAGQYNVSSINRNAKQTVEVQFRGFKVYLRDIVPGGSSVTLNVNVTTMRINVKSQLGNPVPNVVLTLTYNNGTATFTNTTTTGNDGSATIPLMPNATYAISMKYRGYDVGTISRSYGGSPLTLTAELYSIRAKVETLEGEPVPSATVRVWYGTRQSGNTTGFASATTNSEGVAEVDLLPAGSYPLNVEYNSETVYQSTTAITVSGPSTPHLARTDLTRYRVRVLDADGADLITGIGLEGRLYLGDTPYGGAASTTSGELSFGLVRARTYTLVVKMGELEVFRGEVSAPAVTSINARFYDAVVRVDAAGTPSQNLLSSVTLRLRVGSYTVEKTTSQSAARFTNLPAAQYSYEIVRGPYTIGTGQITVNSDEQAIVIRPTLYTVKLRLVNDLGEGIPATATLRTHDDIQVATITASEDGTATLSGLIPILYRGKTTFRNVAVDDGFEFTLDQDNKEVVVTTKVYTPVFTVLDFDGVENIGKATVTVSSENIVEEGTTNSTGKVVIRNLPIKTYTVRVTYLGIPVHEENVRVDSSREIRLKASGIIDVELEILDDESRPLEEGSVQIVLGAAKYAGGISGGRARFENIPAGAYAATVQYKNLTVYDKRLAPFRDDEESVKINVMVYYLRLTLVKSDGTPLSQAAITAKYSGRLITQAFTDQAGRAELKLPRGDFAVDVTYQDTAVASQTISVVQSTNLQLKTKVYKVEVRVVGPDGTPVGNAEISVARGDKLIEKTTTKEDGSASFYVAEGDYTWTTKIGGYTYTSKYSSKGDKQLTIVHVVDDPQLQGIVLAATAAVSVSSVFGLIRWGRLKPATRQRPPARSRQQLPSEERRPATLKRTRQPRV